MNGGIVQNDLRFAILDRSTAMGTSAHRDSAQSPRSTCRSPDGRPTTTSSAEAELAATVQRRAQAEEEVKARKPRRRKADPV